MGKWYLWDGEKSDFFQVYILKTCEHKLGKRKCYFMSYREKNHFKWLFNTFPFCLLGSSLKTRMWRNLKLYSVVLLLVVIYRKQGVHLWQMDLELWFVTLKLFFISMDEKKPSSYIVFRKQGFQYQRKNTQIQNLRKQENTCTVKSHFEISVSRPVFTVLTISV